VEEPRKNRAVVIEDNEEVASLLERTLSLWGFSVARVEPNDRIPLTLKEIAPSIIFLSSDVPKGFTICHKIKKDADLRKTPLILLSERANPETLKKHMALPTRADVYLRKPFAEGLLRGILKNLGFSISEDASLSVDMPERTLYQPSIHAQAIATYVEEEVSSVKGMLAKLEQEKAAMEQRVMQLEKELMQERQRLNEVLASVSKEVDVTRVSHFEQEIQKAKEVAKKETEAMLQALRREVERLTLEVVLAKKAEEEARAKLADTSGLFESLEAGYKEAMERLELENQELREQVDIARTEVVALQERIRQMEEKEKDTAALMEKALMVEDLEKEVMRLRKEKEVLSARAEEMKETLEQAQEALKKVEALEMENRQLREEMAKVKDALKKEREMRENTEKAYEALKSRLDQIRQALGTVSMVIKDEG
jgi:DNA-binding response OmpR family regulator